MKDSKYKSIKNCIPIRHYSVRKNELTQFNDKQILFESEIRGLVNLKHEEFGRRMMKWIRSLDGFHDFEESEDIMEIAEKCDLAERVPYEPEIHGEIEFADPGDQIWWYPEETKE